ncbi:ribonuclease P [Salvia divinorum]|uniref:Ribonuclease P n=1 Tax=Salvia divinorum TaxID=28513 RepID=A0ABD1HTN3_SALDI
MGFFDLNIPYRESDRHAVDKPSLRGRRLKLALKAMELGYTGVAYNRTLTGVMSESDRCSIVLFPISTLTPSSSSFFASVKFHRDILHVAGTAPFRQYTRLTVVVTNSSQALALNSGNPVLRSYDIVAVRPTRQDAFDQACQTSEVDMISIDFSKMDSFSFRLRQPMIKAAIKRGLYFEITYSDLIGDAESKRKMISNCKLLVDWTRGKNLIICSDASSATELRGPQDVANLFFMLGLSRERAKAAISSNCRSLLANAIRKKHFYKEAVKVEEVPSGGQSNTSKSVFDDWLKWDPISSGQGDVLLEDMEKSFSISKTVKENVKTIHFTSNLNGLPAHGLQIKDLVYVNKADLELCDVDKRALPVVETEGGASDEKLEKQIANTLHEQHHSLLKKEGGLGNLSNEPEGVVELPECQTSPSGASNIYANSDCQDSEVLLGYVVDAKLALLPLPGRDQVSIEVAQEEYQISGLGDSSPLSLPTFSVNSADSEEILKTSNDLEQNTVASETQLKDHPSPVQQGNCLHGGGRVHITKSNTFTIDNHITVELSNPLNKSSSSIFPLDPCTENLLEMGACANEGNRMDEIHNKNAIENTQEYPFASPHIYEDGYVEGGECSKITDSSMKFGVGSPLEGSSNMITNFDEPTTDDVRVELKQIDSVPDCQDFAKSRAGTNKRKGKLPHQPFLFPFKRYMKSKPSKKKPRK